MIATKTLIPRTEYVIERSRTDLQVHFKRLQLTTAVCLYLAKSAKINKSLETAWITEQLRGNN